MHTRKQERRIDLWLITAVAFLWFLLIMANCAHAHDPYSSWKDNRGYSCCSGDEHTGDCRPTTTCETGWGALGVMMYGRCVPVPPDVVLHIPSPDNRTHACMRPGALQPMCVVIGPNMY
jgi:hypothetical protein